MPNPFYRLIALLAATAGCSGAAPSTDAPILLQGALRMETNRFVAALAEPHADTAGSLVFWRGTVDGLPVVVSETRMGGTHAAAATAIAIERYHPRAIINAGTAGGHDSTLHVGDIVVGVAAVSISAFKTPARAVGAGSTPLEWHALDLVQRAGDADGEMHEGQTIPFTADGALLNAARRATAGFTKGRVVEGVIASSDVWNQELDRIALFRRTLGTSVEEMETAPAAQVAKLYGIPFLGIRAVTANVTNGGAYDARTAEAAQEFALRVLRAYAAK